MFLTLTALHRHARVFVLSHVAPHDWLSQRSGPRLTKSVCLARVGSARNTRPVTYTCVSCFWCATGVRPEFLDCVLCASVSSILTRGTRTRAPLLHVTATVCGSREGPMKQVSSAPSHPPPSPLLFQLLEVLGDRLHRLLIPDGRGSPCKDHQRPCGCGASRSHQKTQTPHRPQQAVYQNVSFPDPGRGLSAVTDDLPTFLCVKTTLGAAGTPPFDDHQRVPTRARRSGYGAVNCKCRCHTGQFASRFTAITSFSAVHRSVTRKRTLERPPTCFATLPGTPTNVGHLRCPCVFLKFLSDVKFALCPSTALHHLTQKIPRNCQDQPPKRNPGTPRASPGGGSASFSLYLSPTWRRRAVERSRRKESIEASILDQPHTRTVQSWRAGFRVLQGLAHGSTPPVPRGRGARCIV